MFHRLNSNITQVIQQNLQKKEPLARWKNTFSIFLASLPAVGKVQPIFSTPISFCILNYVCDKIYRYPSRALKYSFMKKVSGKCPKNYKKNRKKFTRTYTKT